MYRRVYILLLLSYFVVGKVTSLVDVSDYSLTRHRQFSALAQNPHPDHPKTFQPSVSQETPQHP